MDIELNPADRVRLKFTSIGFDHDWLVWDRMYHHLFTSNINSPVTAYIVRDSLDAEETFKTILSSVDIHFKSKWVENWRKEKLHWWSISFLSARKRGDETVEKTWRGPPVKSCDIFVPKTTCHSSSQPSRPWSEKQNASWDTWFN